ncbi:MAG: PIG-L family deacetylase [Microgenomates group bacterium]
MKIIIILIAILFILFICFWLYGFNEANDLKVPTKNINDFNNIKKVLIIFPHPDDEANSLGGTITQFVDKGIEINWIILTKGEKGNDDAHFDDNLKYIRSIEAQNVAKILGIKKLTLKDYPDNGVDQFKDDLIDDVRQTIKEIDPDLVITYDESGGYGHPDHIVLSKVATELINNEFENIHLWYTSTPEKLFKKLSLPEQMAKDKNFKFSRKSPSFKIWVGISGVINKVKAVYAYQSQFSSFVKSVPVKQIPMWFYISLTPYEYFYEVK